MGNTQGAQKFLTAEPQWDTYVGSEWRSDEARELDKLGGLNRPAVCMADTMAAKLGFLENRLRNQGDDILRALDKPQEGSGRARAGIGPPTLHQQPEEKPPDQWTQNDVVEYRGPATWVDAGLDPILRGRSLLARQRMIEYAKIINANNKQSMPAAPPAVSKLNNGRVRRSSNLSTVSVSTNVADTGTSGDDVINNVLEVGRVSGAASQSLLIAQMAATLQPLASMDSHPANWRIKIHDARRRATIVIRAVIRLKRGMNHPRRMQRIDSFSFYIPQLLGENVGKFSEEQNLYAQIQEEVSNCKAAISEILERRLGNLAPSSKPQSAAAIAASAAHALAAAAAATAGAVGPGLGAASAALSLVVAAAATAGAGGPGLGAAPLLQSVVPVPAPPIGPHPTGKVLAPLRTGSGPVLEMPRSPRHNIATTSTAAATSTSSSGATTDGSLLQPHPPLAQHSPQHHQPQSPQHAQHQHHQNMLQRFDQQLQLQQQHDAAAAASSRHNGYGDPTSPNDGSGGGSGGQTNLLPLVGLSTPNSPSWRKQGSPGPPARLSFPGNTSSGSLSLPDISNSGRRSMVILEESSAAPAPAGRRSMLLIDESGDSAGDWSNNGSSSMVRMVNGRLVRTVRQSSDGAIGSNGSANDGSSHKFLSIIRSRNQNGSGAPGPSPTAEKDVSILSPTTSSSLPGIAPPREKPAMPIKRAGRFSESGGIALGGGYAKPSIRSQANVPSPELFNKKASGRTSDAGGGGGNGLSFHNSRNLDSLNSKPAVPIGPPPDSPFKRKPDALAAGQHFEKLDVLSTYIDTPVDSPKFGNRARRSSDVYSLMDEAKFQELARPAYRPGGASAPFSVTPAQYGTLSPLQRFRTAARTFMLAARINRINALTQTATSELERLTLLCWRLGLELSRLKRSGMMLGMFANRGNAAWAERQAWGPPSVWTVAEQDAQLNNAGGGLKQQVDVAMLIKRGEVAVQIFAGEDYLTLPNGASRDLWTSDPWALVAACRPGALHLTDRIQGLAMGTRIMMQLALAVEALAGREAVSKMFVVLHINDGQQYEAIADLADHGHFGFKPERVLITLQNRRPGYRYDQNLRCFQADNMGGRESIGTGYALAQMSWVGEAFHVTDAAVPVHLKNTVLEHLSANGVEWLSSRRARDLCLLNRDGALDPAALTFSFQLQAKHNVTMTLQVALTDSPVMSRAHDSVVLAHYDDAAAPPQKNPSKARPTVQCVDLRCSELCSPVMVDLIADVSQCAHNQRLLVVGLHRYVFHIPSLRQHLSEMSAFRPKLSRYGISDLVHVTLEMSDLTAQADALCMAVQTRMPTDMLFSAKDIDAIVPLMLAQDNDPAFRDLISRTHPALGPGGPELTLATSAASVKGQGKPGQRIVVFISSSEVTSTAVSLVAQMARPGRDVVHLVTVVPASMQQEAGEALIKPHFQKLARNLVETRSEVIIKGCMGLVECLERYVVTADANLVVMGSKCLTAGALNSVFNMGSLSLSCLKRLQVPMMLVTANSHNVSAAATNKTEFRVLGVADIHARPMLNYLCGLCMDPRRGDRLMLAHCHPTESMTTSQTTARRRLMDTFTDIARGHNLPPAIKAELCGPPWEKPLLAFVQEHGIHVLGVQVPAGNRSIPGQVLQLIRSCRGAVLLYRETM